MLDIILIAIGIPILAVLSTYDKPNNSSTKENYKRSLHKKYNNMTSSELDYHMKQNTYSNEYEGCSREYKINRIIEREVNK